MRIFSILGHARAGIYCLSLTTAPRYRGRQETRVTPFAAMARNLCSQLGDLSNCCHKVLPTK